jgi:ankyrin repeat protein
MGPAKPLLLPSCDDIEAGKTALHAVSLKQDLTQAPQQAKGLLLFGISAPCDAGCLPLHAAAASNNSKAIQALLDHSLRHLDSHCKASCGSAALHLATQHGALEALEALLLAGADANVRRGSDGLTALHIASQLGDVSAVQMLLNHGADAWKAAPSGETAAHAAAHEGHAEVMLCLLEREAGLLACQPEQGTVGTPLHVLARTGCHAAALQALLGTPQLVTRALLRLQDSRGYTPLASACEAGQVAAVQLLLGRRHDFSSCDLLQALTAACRQGHAGIVRLLLGSGAADAVEWSSVPEDGHPLLAALRSGHIAVVKALIAAALPLPNSILAEAVRLGDPGILEFLLNAGWFPQAASCLDFRVP